MSTLETTRATGAVSAAERPAPRGIPMTRIASTELRKMFDTRSGFWLMAGIAIAAVLATGAVVLFASDANLTYNSFAAAVGVPMTVILPIVAILSVTGEWSQRSGLTTFTIVPNRGRVIAAKAAVSVAVGVVSILLAAGIGAVGNLVGTAIAGVDPVWNLSVADVAEIVLANVLGLLVGFMLGVLIRGSAGAIVGYFVYSFVLPTLAALLAASQHWFRVLQPWVDFNFAQGALYNGSMKAQDWAHLAVTGAGWLVIPTALGVWLVMRSEVK
ncbi:MAG: type transport system permease protein [Nocardioidaceae bacterium]|nr:type transport system permease protein [Nocardioidaceae bacterium]